MKLTFLGANHEVTGSRTLLEWLPGRYLLVDDGMIQGNDEYINAPLPVSPGAVEYVLLTHAHIDHSGNLPLLVKQGFRGAIYCTAETANLCSIMLADSAHIQETEAQSQSKKNLRAGLAEVEPLYTAEDVQQTMKLFRPCEYGRIYQVDEGLSIRFTDIGHLLGSSAIECFLEEAGQRRTMVFSGDVGNTDQPIINDPQPVAAADYLLLESTYGDRLHEREKDPIPLLVDVLRRTFDRGGTVIIPSFAVGRTQELLYFFREIRQRKLLPEYPDFPVYVDSPMANEATAVFLQCDISCLDEETRKVMAQGENPIWFEGLRTVTETADSKLLNANTDPKVVISSGGMCEGGRIRHHLKHNLWNEKNTILFVGYQANGTLGRIIYDGAKEVKIYGETIEVKAEIQLLAGVSGHADQQGLMNWLRRFETKPKIVFVNHGEDEACEALSKKIIEDTGIPALAPYSGSSFNLLAGEWIRLEPPVPKEKPKEKEKEKKASNRRKKAAGPYSELLRAAESLLAKVQTMQEAANGDIRVLTEEIRKLL